MRKLTVVVLLFFVVIVLFGCTDDKLSEQRKASVAQRTDVMARAEAIVPIPYTENFPSRKILAEYTKRQDMLNHPWYTYILSDNGTITAYFVSTTLPVSTNAFLGSTEDLYSSSYGNLVLAAPSLDGVYYGGAGSTSSMNGWIFVDATTGAMGVVYGCNIITFDAPLRLEVEPMLIRAGE